MCAKQCLQFDFVDCTNLPCPRLGAPFFQGASAEIEARVLRVNYFTGGPGGPPRTQGEDTEGQ